MYNFINMKFWKRENYYKGKEKDKMVVSQGQEQKNNQGTAQGDF